VGIDKYSDKSNLPNLNCCVNDAKDLEKVLKEKHQFSRTELLLNDKATRWNILNMIERIQKHCNPASRLVVFFAGHGSGEFSGFFFPFDYEEDLWNSAIDMSDIQRCAEYTRNPLHILFVFDCCFSGKVLELDKLKSRSVSMLPLNTRAIQCMTAGASTEPVYEKQGHGVFTKYLLDGLRGDAFTKNWLSARNLTQWISKKMEQTMKDKKFKTKQVPKFGSLSSDVGEFIFFRARPEVQGPSELPEPPKPETVTVSRNWIITILCVILYCLFIYWLYKDTQSALSQADI